MRKNTRRCSVCRKYRCKNSVHRSKTTGKMTCSGCYKKAKGYKPSVEERRKWREAYHTQDLEEPGARLNEGQIWNDHEDALILNPQRSPDPELAVQIGRSPQAIHYRRWKLKKKKKKRAIAA